jgi:hypothetical protein
MSKVTISGNVSGTGTFTIASPNSNTDRTQSLPDGTGTFVLNGVNSAIVSGTAVASTSGTSIDFTGIPSWVKRITVMFSGVSTNGNSDPLVQIGAGSVTASGYSSVASYVATPTATSTATSTIGFNIRDANAAAVRNGHMTISNVSGNTWVSSHTICDLPNGTSCVGAGGVTLAGTLDRVRITTVNGTDTFDAGSINILYE